MMITDQQLVDRLAVPIPAAVNRRAATHSAVLCSAGLVFADGVAALLTIAASMFLQPFSWTVHPGWDIRTDELIMLCIGLGGYFALKGRYTDRIPFWTEAQFVVSTSFGAVAIETGLGVMSGSVTSRIPVLLALIVFVPLTIGLNRLAKLMLIRAGVWMIPVAVVGSRESVEAAERILYSDATLGFAIVSRIDPGAVISGTNGPRLASFLSAHQAKLLIIVTDGVEALGRRLVNCALRERVRFAMFLQPCPASSFATKPVGFFSHDATLLSFQNGLSRRLPRIAKLIMDVVLAFCLLVVSSPLLLVISVAIMTDGGPVLFRQRRLGMNGRSFYCLKFRTMVADADRVLQKALANDPDLAAEWAARHKLADDPRVTRLGRFLRRTSLDELPQLINVLSFQMSLVGPRPIVESEVCHYGEHIAQYYATRPGVTGVWQVSGRSNTSYERRVELDVWYVNNWTLWQDIAVLAKTISVVLNQQGAY